MAIIAKKGWLRIVEVTLAIVLMVGAVFIFYQYKTIISFDDKSDLIKESIDNALLNQTLRQEVFYANPIEVPGGLNMMSTNDEITLNNAIKSEMNRPDLNIVTRICNIDGQCGLYNFNEKKDVSATTKLLSTGSLGISGSTSGVPKKIKVYVWSV